VAVETVRCGVEELLSRLERAMSTYRDDSDVCRFNAHRGTNWFAVSPDIVRVVEEAQRISRLSDGAFDVTAEPLVRLWGFGPQRGVREAPSDDALAGARRSVDYRKLHARVSPPALRKDDPELSVDLSAIAKGYAVDAVAAELGRLGFTGYLVEIGGELKARGNSRHGRPWRVGIERPSDSARGIQRVVELRDQAVATSGDYRNFRVIAGRRHGHIMDPRAGRPVANDLASVSVIHASCMTADALATALTVLGLERGRVLAEALHLPALFIRRSGAGFAETPTSDFQAAAPHTIVHPSR
jgi:thiamine biosynthesis lipoprotein